GGQVPDDDGRRTVGRHANARRPKPSAPPAVSQREARALARPRPRLGAALDLQRSTGRRERGNRRHKKMKRASPIGNFRKAFGLKAFLLLAMFALASCDK